MTAHRNSLDLLKSLEGRVRTGADLLEQQGAIPETRDGHPAAPPRRDRAAPALRDLIPHAERIRFGGKTCYCVTARAGLDGERTAAGHACPAGEFAVERMGEALAMLGRAEAWRGVDPEKIAFIDTETTGLSGGTGTYVFLIGVGRFVGPEFVVRQYFMEDYGEEEALIAAVQADLDRAEAIVSYNGKCFDLPLMETRWRMARRRPAFPALHLDLLFPARRLWRLRCGDCSLGTIEREVLGIRRFSDVESWRIPQIFFDYVEGRRREQMLPVFDHHAQDIFSLGALVRAMARALEAPEDPRFAHAGEQWGLAGIYAAAGREADHLAALERAILAARDEDFGFRLSMHLARRLRRAGRIAEAVEIWEARAGQAQAGRLDPLIALAKHAEHRLKDFASARRWTDRAIALTIDARELEPLRHRLRRVLKKSGDECHE